MSHEIENGLGAWAMKCIVFTVRLRSGNLIYTSHPEDFLYDGGEVCWDDGEPMGSIVRRFLFGVDPAVERGDLMIPRGLWR